MTPIQISGTPAEVRKQFAELSLPEEMTFDILIKASDKQNDLSWTDIEKSLDENWEQHIQQMRDDNAQIKAFAERAAMMSRYDEEFADVPRVYGILQVPTNEVLTVERIKELSED